ncbi:NAD(P)/FAD-dependent oxidoreductase [Eubacteriales bacterium OttesenSCG-928-N14]|nr:NAD(P)/FAD-dependent oxidoreductase [Eubacteriales bacterium OttesenSCG-928-N14]
MHRLSCQVAIIGGGPAGLAAAKGAIEAGADDIILIERDDELGGILNQCIHAGFGLHTFDEELTGPEYAARFFDVAEHPAVRVYLGAMALSIAPGNVTMVSRQTGLVQIAAKSIVLAMGCRERPRGALAIPGTRPSGIYSAGTAQRMVNMQGEMPGKQVMILGSGDIGLIMARRMCYEGATVHAVCEILPYSSGLSRNIAQCLNDLNIPLLLEHTVIDIHGQDRLTGVTIARVDENRLPIPGSKQYYDCDTLLLSVGLIPENELSLQAGIEMDAVTGGAVVNSHFMTKQPGIFACGNALHVHDLVDYVTEESTIAGAHAAHYALGQEMGRIIGRTLPGEHVRYVVPQTILDGHAQLTLRFRVDAPLVRSRIEVFCGDALIFSANRLISTPGEMETIVLDEPVHGDICVHVRGVGK